VVNSAWYWADVIPWRATHDCAVESAASDTTNRRPNPTTHSGRPIVFRAETTVFMMISSSRRVNDVALI
jgi:hypothetical protein